MNVRVLLISALVLGAFAAGVTLPVAAEPAPGFVEDADREATKESGVLSGQVSGSDSPLMAAGVYAYRLADLTLRKALTDGTGRFSFAALPAGIYKIIAHKPGFVPAVVLLTRTTAGVYQFLDFRLAEVSIEDEGIAEQDFWSVRERIPGDILRQMQVAEADAVPTDPQPSQRFQTALRALSGTDSVTGLGDAQITGGDIDLLGRLGAFELAFQGAFRELQASSELASALGQAAAVTVSLQNEDNSLLRVHSQQNTLARTVAPVDLERYGVSWSQSVGRSGRSSFAAQFTNESNYYNDSRFDGLGLADASKTFKIEGAYEGRLGADTSLQTGVSYRERVWTVDPIATALPLVAPRERLEVFGLADWTVGPAMVVQYGLLTTLSNGEAAVMPQGGLVLQLGDDWSAETFARQRLTDEPEDRLAADFVARYYGGRAECGSVEEHCYTLRFTRRLRNDGAVSLGALHREFSDTLRVFFSEDFFDQLQSVMLVDGDQLPEIQFAISQRLSDNVLATLQSNVASGGGGMVRATDDGAYQNEVRYQVTSLNTEFEQTSTGLLLAFHRMQQALTPVDLSQAAPDLLDMDRLQILFTQELDAILGVANDWAIQLDMEFSKGSNPWDVLASDELRKRIVGGLAMKF